MSEIKYIWEQPYFPHFRYDREALRPLLTECRMEISRLHGATEMMCAEEREELQLDQWTEEARLTSDIEGIRLSREDVRSSLERHLREGEISDRGQSRQASRIATMMALVKEDTRSETPLTEGMLLRWHQALMEGREDIHVGAWRSSDRPMQILSGQIIGRETIHYEAPPSEMLPRLLSDLLDYANALPSDDPEEVILHAGIVHLYFETLHPLEDGNGRIGRALSQRDLELGLGRSLPISLSATIDLDRSKYYDHLEEAQRGDLDITEWLRYWTALMTEATQLTMEWAKFISRKAAFIDRMQAAGISERQEKALRRMLDEGPRGFTGGMTARKYSSLTRVSKATATRDLSELTRLSLLTQEGQGRSTAYHLSL